MAIDQINSESDLVAFIGTQENKSIEFKETLPDNKHTSRKEFLADVSSFANASGGNIVYGIRSKDGVATELIGLESINSDDEIIKLENILLHNVKPRLQGHSITPIPLANGKVAIVVRVPQSFNAPHVLDFEGHWRFYSRNSAGKYPLDVDEVRLAFSASEALPDRIRNFRTNRLSRIISGEGPISLPETGKIILHLLPVQPFSQSLRYDLTRLIQDQVFIYSKLNPIKGSITGKRYNLDGILTYTKRKDGPLADSYTQVFLNGCIEAVDTYLLSDRYQNDTRSIPSVIFEQELSKAIENYFHVLRYLKVEAPVFLMLSLIGVKGYYMGTKQQLYFDEVYPIDRDTLIIPEFQVMDLSGSLIESIKSVFDSVWNAAGWARSLNYDNEGNWNPR